MARKLKAIMQGFSRLKCKKISAADRITSETAKNSKNNLFTRKQTANKVLPKRFRGFEVRTKVQLMHET